MLALILVLGAYLMALTALMVGSVLQLREVEFRLDQIENRLELYRKIADLNANYPFSRN